MGRFGIAGRIATPLAAAALVASFALAPAPARAATRDIDVRSNVFDPVVTHAVAGDQLRWTVTQGSHTIHAYAGGTFAWGYVTPGDVKTFSFEGGTALYRCQFHSSVDNLTLVCQGMCAAVTDRTAAPGKATIALPSSGASIPTQTVRIEGGAEAQTTVRLLENGVEVGRAVAHVESGSPSPVWRADVSLARGPHTIVARAVDVDGRAGPDSDPRSFTVTADTQAPTVAIDGSGPQVQIRRPSVVSGTAADDLALAAVEVGIRQPWVPYPLDVFAPPPPPRIVRIAVGGTFSTWRMSGELGFGVWLVSARAIDAAGNASPWSPEVTVAYLRPQE